jgi:hypothetical protein
MRINYYIFHLTQIFTPILAWWLYDWRAFVIVFLIMWCINTEKYSDQRGDKKVL